MAVVNGAGRRQSSVVVETETEMEYARARHTVVNDHYVFLRRTWSAVAEFRRKSAAVEREAVTQCESEMVALRECGEVAQMEVHGLALVFHNHGALHGRICGCVREDRDRT